MSKRGTVEERLLRNYQPIPHCGCWIWLGSINKWGYGQIMMPNGKPDRVHRVSYRLFKGKIPKKLDVRHSCDIRCCINPDHLDIGTRKQNMDDAESRGRIARRFKLPQTRLTDEQVAHIVADSRFQYVIAKEFGIDQSYVSDLKSGRATRIKNAARCS